MSAIFFSYNRIAGSVCAIFQSYSVLARSVIIFYVSKSSLLFYSVAINHYFFVKHVFFLFYSFEMADSPIASGSEGATRSQWLKNIESISVLTFYNNK